MIQLISSDVYDSIVNENDKVLSFLARDKETKEFLILSSFSDKKELLVSNYDGTEIKRYPNEKVLFKDLNESIKNKLNHPLFKYRFLMGNIKAHKDELINELFEVLEMKLPQNILMTNFNLLNDKLIKCGLENIYNEYYLHLILFSIEYLNKVDKNQGKLILKHNSNYPLSFQPSFIDSKNKDYYFSLNVNLARELQARFLGEDYAADQDVELNTSFNYKEILNLALDYRDLIKD